MRVSEFCEDIYSLGSDFIAELEHIRILGCRKKSEFQRWAVDLEFQNKLRKKQELVAKKQLQEAGT